MERAVTLARPNAYDLHARLLPQLREIARRSSSGPAGARPRDARPLVGAAPRPTAPRPSTGSRRGIPLADLRALVADLERIG